jgi:glycosyltransferase involved in cell wall biosynthesis
MTDLNVSVVMPTYNGSAFVTEALQSVFAQTQLPAEIIVVDDCSKDDTLDLVQALAATSPVPLRAFQLPRNTGGPAEPLNVAMERATSPIIAVLEQDDVMRQTRLERQLQLLAQHRDSDFCSGRLSVMGLADRDTTPIWGARDQLCDVAEFATAEDSPIERGRISQATAFRALLRRNFCASNSTFTFRRSLIDKIGGFSTEVVSCTDLEFVLRAAVVTPFCWVDEAVVDYRWRPESLYRENKARSTREAECVRFQAAWSHPALAGGGYWDTRARRRAAVTEAMQSGHLWKSITISFDLLRGDVLRQFRLRA